MKQTTWRRYLGRRYLDCAVLGIVLSAFLVSNGCRPSVVLQVSSPDGSLNARVLDHPTFDGPAHSIWVFEEGVREPLVVERLGEDTDWCNHVVWSNDSRWVAFLIQDAVVRVYQFREGSRAYAVDLVQRNNYPTTEAVRSLTIADSGEVTYEVCPRRSSDRSLCRTQTRSVTSTDISS